PAPGTPLLRRYYDLVGVPGCVPPLVLAVVRLLTFPAVGTQPVLLTPVFVELGHRQLALAARAALRRHRLHDSFLSLVSSFDYLEPHYDAARAVGYLVMVLGRLRLNESTKPFFLLELPQVPRAQLRHRNADHVFGLQIDAFCLRVMNQVFPTKT